MSKNAEGWVRHRGGKCPVEIGDIIDVRHRSGEVISCVEIEGSGWYWDHHGNSFDIMAYRLHKPVEQVEACSKPELRSLPENYGEIIGGSVEGPIQWRDRITEIDATTQALTTKRAELVQRLASEGFALIGRVVEPVEDYGNIQIGDLVSVISIGGFSDCTGLSVGDIVEVTSVDNDESLKTVSGGSWGSIGYNYKFHSRPSA